jgi:hypothetical protein
MFEDISRRRMDTAFDTMAKHAATERRNWIDGASVARAMNAADDFVAYAGDQKRMEASLAAGRAEIVTNAQDHGEDPIITDRKLREFDTRALVGGIQKWANRDPIGAQKYYQASKHRIDGQQQIGLERMLKEATARRRADDEANAVMARPVGVDALHDAIVGHESGGRQTDATGNTLTSKKGAKGAGQIIPETFARFARPGEKIDDEKDNLAVSRRMIEKYMRDYNGDWQRAAVAYFSGEGNVSPQANVKPWKVNSSDGNNTVEQYVANVGRRMGLKPGEPASVATVKTSTDPREKARDIEANFAGYVDAMEKLHPNDPEQRALGIAELRRRKALAEEAVASEQKAVGEQALQIAITPGANGLKPTSRNDIPNDLWTKLSASQQHALLGVFNENVRQQDRKPNPALYAELSRQAAEDPAEFVRRDLVPLADQLPEADWKHFQNMQGLINRKDARAAEQQITVASAMRVSKALLTSAGIYMGYLDRKGTATDKKAYAEFEAAYQGALLKEAEQFRVDNKRKPNDEELQKMADRLLMQGRSSETGRTQALGLELSSDDKSVAFQPRPVSSQFYVRYGDIPSDRRKAIEDQLKAKGLPNDKHAVENAYTAWRMVGNK